MTRRGSTRMNFWDAGLTIVNNNANKNMKTQYKVLTVLPCVALLLASMAFVSTRAADTNENAGQFSATDYKFAREAATGGMLEVNLGHIAATNSQNTAVQQFAQRMVNDHGKAGLDLAAIAARKGATLPAEVTARQQKEIDRLAKMSGAEFDRSYVAFMVRCHKMDERLFKRESESGQDTELKTFATNTLVTVQDHLKMADDLEGTLKHAPVSE